jgi:hypothetical protein
MRRFTFAFLLLAAGCCSVPKNYDPIMAFQRKHPKEFAKYIYINPAVPDSYGSVVALNYGFFSGGVDGLEHHFADRPQDSAFVKRWVQTEGRFYQKQIDYFRGLSKEVSKGGAVCQYRWSDGKTEEFGFLVLKSGDVIRREPWITDYLSEQNAATEH